MSDYSSYPAQEDQGWIDEQMTKDRVFLSDPRGGEMKKMESNEAAISINTRIKSPAGFEYQLTFRKGATSEDFSSLMKLVDEKEKVLANKGFTPVSGNKYPQKQVDYVQGRTCPNDGAKLIYATKKDGTKYIKCENNKWDKANNRPTGCQFVEWPDKPMQPSYEDTRGNEY